MNLFLDTMVYLHYEPIEQIDFRPLFPGGPITIAIPRITLRELEKHKSTHTLSRTRNRARQTLSYLEQKLRSDKLVRDGVTLSLIPTSPGIDFAAFGLNPDWNDDQLIAAVLEWKSTHSTEDTKIVTDDVGMRLVCKHHGIDTVEIPDKYRLPEELDETQKEIQTLRRDLQRAQAALPAIALSFLGSGTTNIRFSIKQTEIVNEAKIADALSKQKLLIPEQATAAKIISDSDKPPYLALMTQFQSFAMPSEEEIKLFNTNRLKYFKDYEEYLRDCIEAKNILNRSFRFVVEISNPGSAPADDVDIHLHFPDGFLLQTAKEFPNMPEEPERPREPKGPFDRLSAGFEMPDMLLPKMLPAIRQSSFRIRKTNSYDVRDHIDRIKHGTSVRLPELVLTFRSYDQARSFSCDFEATVANMPSRVQGKLHFVVEKSDAP